MIGGLSERTGTTKPKVLLIGFSNTAMPIGYATVLVNKFGRACPGGEIVRVGLGALQPFVIPSFMRLADRQHGPFSHVLFEINTSAFAIHPKCSEAIARELLADMVLTARDIGAEPGFLILYRDFGGKALVDLNGQTRSLCAEYDIPVLDLAESLVAERGEEFVRSLLRDRVHTTDEGMRLQVERALPFLLDFVARPPRTRNSLPKAQLRRGYLDIADRLPDLPRETISLSNLALDYVLLDDGETASLDFGQELSLQGLMFLYHRAGGHADISFADPNRQTHLKSIDPFSYYTRIGIQGFNGYLGETGQTLRIDGVCAATDVKLNRTPRREAGAPSGRQRLGPVLTLEPAD